MLSQSCYISDRHVKCGSCCHTCKSMGSRKDITSGMACILCEYYSTSGETSFLFLSLHTDANLYQSMS
jgi:hypothetical protein